MGVVESYLPAISWQTKHQEATGVDSISLEVWGCLYRPICLGSVQTLRVLFNREKMEELPPQWSSEKKDATQFVVCSHHKANTGHRWEVSSQLIKA